MDLADPALPRCDTRTTAVSPCCVVKEKERDWGLNRALSGSVPHKNKYKHYQPFCHAATASRTQERVSLTCQPPGDRTVKTSRLFNSKKIDLPVAVSPESLARSINKDSEVPPL